MGNDNPTTRRKCLRAIGGVSATGVTIGSMPIVTQAEGETDEKIVSVPEDRLRNLLSTTSENNAYKELTGYVSDEYGYSTDFGNPTAHRVIKKDEQFEVISIPLIARDSNSANDVIDKSLAVKLKGKAVDGIKVIISEKISENSKKTTLIESVDSETIEESDFVSSEDIGIQNDATCSACESVVRVACSAGCAIGASAICFIVGSLPGAVACGSLASSVCAAMQEYRESTGNSPCTHQNVAWMMCQNSGNC